MVELGDHGVEEVYEVSAAPGALGAQIFDAGLEMGKLGLVIVWFVLDMVAFCYLAEGDEVQTLVQLGEEDVTVVAQEAGAQAQFT